jgi:hypothetical protein
MITRPITILAENSVPFYAFLNRYDWINDFLKCENLKIQLEKLRERESQIKRLPCDPADVLTNLRQSFEAHQDRQIETLKTFIERNWENSDLLQRFVSECESPHAGVDFMQVPDLRFFETALKRVRIPGETIKNKKREAILDKLASEIAGLKVDLTKLSPQNFFMKSRGGIILDIREAFVEHWADYQRQANAPCNPRGLVLEYCEPAEQEAWRKLNLKQYVDPEAQFLPNEG